jgi:hypothetical protein
MKIGNQYIKSYFLKLKLKLKTKQNKTKPNKHHE